ncbi:hypothetical protein MTYP_03267 [Methylophilaceae bacterium]|nr:hypothetical protein MTYP_03267 [Methylophilaceae bacterium]
MNKDFSVDYEMWDLKDAFSCLEAAYLWCGVDPYKVEEEDYNNFNSNLKRQIEKKAKVFELAAQEEKLTYDDKITMRDARRIKCAPIPKFTRVSFRKYADGIGQRPHFLFPEDRRLVLSDLGELDALTIKVNAVREAFGYQTKGIPMNNLQQLFDALSLHTRLIKVSKQLFVDGHYSQSIFEAFKAVNNAVKKKSGVDKDGQTLMAHVFNEEGPLIRLNPLKTQSDINEQKGFKLLYMGAMAGIRNPKAHDHVMQADPLRTLRYLAFASLLMERIDEGTRSRRKMSLKKKATE